MYRKIYSDVFIEELISSDILYFRMGKLGRFL